MRCSGLAGPIAGSIRPDTHTREGTSMNPQGSQHADRTRQRASGTVRAARRVLVVEDEFFLAVQIEEWLLADGFEVVDVVHTAEDAVAVAVAEQPGLVIMDIRLASETDGIAAAV